MSRKYKAIVHMEVNVKMASKTGNFRKPLEEIGKDIGEYIKPYLEKSVYLFGYEGDKGIADATVDVDIKEIEED